MLQSHQKTPVWLTYRALSEVAQGAETRSGADRRYDRHHV